MVSLRASWLSRLHGLLAVAGLAIAVGSVAVVARATVLSMPPIGRLAAACRSWLLPHINLIDLLVLGLAALSITVIGRALRSALRPVRAGRAYLATLHFSETLPGPIPARVIDEATPVAFCVGLWRPSIYISTGAIERLRPEELKAVLAHEAHHATRRDPLRLLIAQSLADGLFFMPVMRDLRRGYASLTELAADEAAVEASGHAGPLASAMLAFGEMDGGHIVAVSAERVDHLMGQRPRWELPVSLLLGAMVTVGGLAALVVAAARATQLAQSGLPMLLMQACGPLMVGIAALMVVGVVRRHRNAPWAVVSRLIQR